MYIAYTRGTPWLRDWIGVFEGYLRICEDDLDRVNK
jgi:hypothetical protein